MRHLKQRQATTTTQKNARSRSKKKRKKKEGAKAHERPSSSDSTGSGDGKELEDGVDAIFVSEGGRSREGEVVRGRDGRRAQALEERLGTVGDGGGAEVRFAKKTLDTTNVERGESREEHGGLGLLGPHLVLLLTTLGEREGGGSGTALSARSRVDDGDGG